MTHERMGRLLAGLSVITTVALGYFHHPAWFLGAAGIALNLALSGITDRCAVKDLLVHMGLPGERDLGRAEARREADADQPEGRTEVAALLRNRLSVPIRQRWAGPEGEPDAN